MPGIFFPNNRLTNCCFCIKLSTGCRIIGSLTALICCMEFLTTINKFMELLERKRKCKENTHWEIEIEQLFHLDCSHITVVRFILITEFIAFLMGFISSCLLLYGIRNKQPKLFIAWQIFIGTVIFSNFFTILFWRDVSMILEKILLVLMLAYFFKVIKSYHSKLSEEMINGYPVVAVTFPQESNLSVFLASQRSNISNEIKDDPPPPYPGPPMIQPSVSIEMQPPPYCVVNPHYAGPLPYDAPSSSSIGELPVPTFSNLEQGIIAPQSVYEESRQLQIDGSPTSATGSCNSGFTSSMGSGISIANNREIPSASQLAASTISSNADIQETVIANSQPCSDRIGVLNVPPQGTSIHTLTTSACDQSS